MAGVLKPSPGALRIIDDLEEGLAIVVNGNTAPKNIAAGQYLFIKNHSTLATGGYHATAAISSGGTISSSNVAADADGIANSLNSKMQGIGTISYTTATKVTALSGDITKVGRLAMARFDFSMTASETSNWIDCGTVSIPPSYDVTTNIVADSSTAVVARVRITEDGIIKVFYGGSGNFHVNVCYRCAL